MIKVTVRDSMYKREVIVDAATTTIRDAFEQAGIDYDTGIITLSGTIIGRDELDDYLSTHTSNESAVLNVNRKTDNAATIIVANKAVVLRSEATLGEIKKLAKYKPEALVLTKDDVPVFKVGITDTNASVGQYGISFLDKGEDDQPAAVSMLYVGDDVNTFVKETIGPALLKLEQLELGFNVALEEIGAEEALIESRVTVL